MLRHQLTSRGDADEEKEFGDNCTANEVAPPNEDGYTLTTLAAPAGGLPLTAPSAGVITKVKLSISEPIPLALPTSVKVLRSAGGNNYTVVGHVTVPILPGTFADTRLPVQAGDRLGLHGQSFTYEGSEVPSFSFYCDGSGDGAILGAAEGDTPAGSTAEFDEVTEGRIPLAGILEPDADNDGYGDETQDKCPQNAATQGTCPVVIAPVTLGASSVAKKGFVTVLITSNAQAPVTVGGTVKLGKKGKPATLSGGTQIVAAGAIAKFRLLFPQALKAKLKLLSPKQSLSLAVTATATNSAGVPSASNLKVKLKGQAKPKRHAKAKAKPKGQA